MCLTGQMATDAISGNQGPSRPLVRSIPEPAPADEPRSGTEPEAAASAYIAASSDESRRDERLYAEMASPTDVAAGVAETKRQAVRSSPAWVDGTVLEREQIDAVAPFASSGHAFASLLQHPEQFRAKDSQGHTLLSNLAVLAT